MKSRGFTLLELLATMGVLGITMSAFCALHFESRVATARTEARVSMQRSASLATEVLSKEIRAAAQVEYDKTSITFDGERIYEVTQGELRDPRKRVLARHVKSMVIDTDGPRTYITLTFERFAAIKRTLRLKRTFFADSRR